MHKIFSIMKAKKTTVAFDMREMSKALQEMISENSPHATEALLSGAREAVFREIFNFHYPSFLSKLRQRVPGIEKSEELVCMLIALQQHTDEMVDLLYVTPERIKAVFASMEEQLHLASDRELGTLMKGLLKE